MGQKVHPKGIRLGIIHTWDSNWIAFDKGYAKNVKEDYDIRTFLKKRLKNAFISRIEIDRKSTKLIIRIITGRPGMIVGRGGQGLDILRKDLNALTKRKDIQLDVMEVARIDADSTLVAEAIAFQLEKRVAFRRAMKQAMQRTMRAGAKGIKVMVAGRLGGAEIARTEWAKEGRIPLHTFRADIDYGTAQAVTLFGIIGVKVWIFKGEVLPGEVAESNVKAKARPNEDRGPGNQAQGLHGGGGRRGPGGPGGGPGGDRGRRGKGPRRDGGGQPGGHHGGGHQQQEQRQPAPEAQSNQQAPSAGEE